MFWRILYKLSHITWGVQSWMLWNSPRNTLSAMNSPLELIEKILFLPACWKSPAYPAYSGLAGPQIEHTCANGATCARVKPLNGSGLAIQSALPTRDTQGNGYCNSTKLKTALVNIKINRTKRESLCKKLQKNKQIFEITNFWKHRQLFTTK